jgi:Spy/CpxP family protein refolding chaperone
MKVRTFVAAAAALALVAGVVVAQPYGFGPGMMGGGYGMGPAMMGGGYGYGMGPGMMGGGWRDAYSGLNLNDGQRKQIADIQETTSKAMWQLMGTMHQQGYAMHGMYGPGGAADDASARQAYEAMSATRKSMFEMQLEARRKIEAVLTQDQRDQLRKSWGSR